MEVEIFRQKFSTHTPKVGESGRMWYIWGTKCDSIVKYLYGHGECKLDEKGRFLFPSSLRRLLTEAEQEEFVLNLNPKGYLDLYPLNRWEKKLEEIFSLNQYIQENRDYARRFQSGATPVQMDKAGRIQVPKSLLAFAGMDTDKNLVIKGMGEVFELWTETRHAQWLNSQAEDLNQMGERLMGNRPPQNPGTPGSDSRFPMK